ncbi:MAG: beta-Ala-His dipeptidase, partial [bacterium]
IITDGCVTALDTTLGADNGIGMSFILAAIDDPNVKHGPLECLFTVDEEIGMIGADSFDDSVLEGRRLINIDSEKEGIIVAGCAGGIRVDSDLPIGRAVIRGMPVMVEISGLRGGHSGEEIHKSRLNAIKLLARYFRELDKEAAFSLCDISGGEKDNAIPVSAKSHFVIEEEDLATVRTFTEKFEAKMRSEYAGEDDSVRVILESGHPHKISVMDPESQDRVIHFLLLLPCGVSVLRDGEVYTSSNLGIARTGSNHFVTTSLVRSALISQRDALADKIAAHTEYMKGNAVFKEAFLPWSVSQASGLRDTMQAVAREFYGKELKVIASHGGLECGLFTSRLEGLDAVSIGPDMKGIHTENESLSISSVARTYDYLVKVLAALH